MSEGDDGGSRRRCGNCDVEYAAAALSCPTCHALTHRERLEALASAAEQAGERSDARREALEQMVPLLPPGCRQQRQVMERLQRLPRSSGGDRARWGRLGGLGALGLLLWKFKALIVFALSKGKLLLLGLTKAKTAFSMLLAIGAYWTIWGWPFAVGFVVSIYIHEMGHVAALRRLGIAASAPMFVPFVGAFVRMQGYPKSEREDAIVGLEGPIYGAAAAIACYALYWVTDVGLFGAVARAGAWVNLFNLLPVWQLDGGRGFNALGRTERWMMTGLLAMAWLLTGDGLLLLVALAAGYRAGFSPVPERSDRRALWTYATLVVVLTSVAAIALPEMSSQSQPVFVNVGVGLGWAGG